MGGVCFLSKMGDWEAGLCGCFSNIGASIIVYVIPCVTYANNAEKAGTCGFVPAMISFFIPGLNWYLGAKTRSDTREKHNIDGSFLGDCICFGFCTPCVLVQNDTQLQTPAMGEEIDRV